MPADVWTDDMMYGSNSECWETNQASAIAVQTKGAGLDKMLVEMSVSEQKWNASPRKNQKKLKINEGDRKAKNDF